MKIRSKLIIIATIPVVLLLVLTGVFLTATNQVERENNKAIAAQEISNQLAALSILTYEHHIYYEERAHSQWVEKYESIGKRLQEQGPIFDAAREKEILERLSRNYRNLGFLFEQYGPHLPQAKDASLSDQAKSFRNRITARLLQELAVTLPAIAKLHELNHDQALALSEQIDAASMLVVGALSVLLLISSFLVIRAFSVPVKTLNEACARVSAGDLACRINSQRTDELGTLSRAFDIMAARLEENDSTLHRLNLDLEGAVKKRTLELSAANDELQLKGKILDAASDSIFLLDSQGTFVMVNETTCKTRGYRREEMIGKLLAAFEPAEYGCQVLSRIQHIFEVGECFFESAHLCKDGTVMPVEIHAQSLEIKGERLIISVARDVSERKQSEDVLRKYALSLERSNKELEHFAYVASHDLQEPLRKIGSFTELLARKYRDKLDDKAGVYLSYIVDGAHRMQILINDLLSFSRVTTKGREFVAVDCNALIARVLLDIEFAVKERDASLSISELPTVMADELQLGQVFQNLLTNALKYCEAGLRPEIKVRVKNNGTDWVFAVSDNGIGIDQQHFERIFQLFQRLHTREEYSGTGIGLALCQKIIERHGGNIWVESTKGQGSTFFFTLPLSHTKQTERQISV